jgi:hypothetical protein
MIPEPENNASWLDDIKELIRKKKEENKALRKVQESLESIGRKRELNREPLVDEEPENNHIKENQSVNNENNPH